MLALLAGYASMLDAARSVNCVPLGLMKRLLSAVMFGSVALLAGACSMNAALFDVPAATITPDDAGSPSDASPINYDSRSDAAGVVSLCNVDTSDASITCNPDLSQQTKLAPMCGAAPADGGKGGYDSGPPAPELACRVAKGATDAPVCSVAGSGGDGAACTTGEDCAAGFECVSSPGRCRHYCCDPTTCKSTGTSNGPFFCDVQTQAAADVPVPVCEPVQPCKLLGDTCGPDATCSIVDPSAGVTSCVAIGPQRVGDSCESAHCGALLACLGAPGKRTCEQLCDASKSDSCPTGQSCKQPWAVLKTSSAGLCQ